MFLEGPLWDVSCDNAYSDALPIFAAGIEFLSGLVPFHIEGELREERKDIFGFSEQARASRDSPFKQFPIAVVAA